MATVKIKWIDNGIGLWKAEGGDYGIFAESNGKHRLQVKTGPDPWDWQVVGFYDSFEEAAGIASDMQRRKWV